MENISGRKREQVSCRLSEELSRRLEGFVASLLLSLDDRIDKRLVRTFYRTLQVVVMFRNRSAGLLLSELGAYILSPAQAPAGTKRLSNLLRSRKWHCGLIEGFLWQQAGDRVTELDEAGELALAVWDESVLEKSESIALEGLSAVRSSKARRLKRIKPGYYNPPGGPPVFVPGMHWLTVLVMGMRGAPTLAAMRWWSRRGPLAEERRTVEQEILKQCWSAWGKQVLHVFDRGYAGGPWLAQMQRYPVRFLMRWQKGFKLVGPDGHNRKAWEITRGKRSMGHRMLWDSRRGCQRKTGIYYCQVSHPESSTPLWLVVSRPGKGRSPWYLLTNEPIEDVDDAWRFVLAYARRWQIEMTYRYAKCELAMESPRLWSWENRLKLLLMVSLVYAFLLSLLHHSFDDSRTLLLRLWCHRTGKRSRESPAPLYRIRAAISHLWLVYPPPPAKCLNPG
jgi:hypothetical protein